MRQSHRRLRHLASDFRAVADLFATLSETLEFAGSESEFRTAAQKVKIAQEAIFEQQQELETTLALLESEGSAQKPPVRDLPNVAERKATQAKWPK